jgi:hypothetical protein
MPAENVFETGEGTQCPVFDGAGGDSESIRHPRGVTSDYIL